MKKDRGGGGVGGKIEILVLVKNSTKIRRDPKTTRVRFQVYHRKTRVHLRTSEERGVSQKGRRNYVQTKN